MDFHENSQSIRWRLHLESPPSAVYQMLSTDQGRARFWAESAVETDGVILFVFPNGQQWHSKIIEQDIPHRFVIRYFGNTETTFELSNDGQGGTVLVLTDVGVPPKHHAEVLAGWVSVLLALKAAVDFGVDLRNHHPRRTWDHGYVEN
jgi:uncharacterized protein YndB with AHSA1/START domain